MASQDRSHPNDPDEIRRKLEHDAQGMTDRERDELRTLLDTAIARLFEGPLEEPAEA